MDRPCFAYAMARMVAVGASKDIVIDGATKRSLRFGKGKVTCDDEDLRADSEVVEQLPAPVVCRISCGFTRR